jgi:hypothetical protein
MSGTAVDGWNSGDDDDGLDFDPHQPLWSAASHEIVVVGPSPSTTETTGVSRVSTKNDYKR